MSTTDPFAGLSGDVDEATALAELAAIDPDAAHAAWVSREPRGTEHRLIYPHTGFAHSQTVHGDRVATQGQLSFLDALIKQGKGDAAMLAEIQERIDTNNLSVRAASVYIDRLKSWKGTASASAPVLDRDGMYRNPDDGAIYKVQFNKATGDGRKLYAKLLVIEADVVKDEAGNITSPAVVRFAYSPGAIRHLRPEWRMSLEQARRFGALYGTCIKCGRTLTDEESITRGIGPVCANGW